MKSNAGWRWPNWSLRQWLVIYSLSFMVPLRGQVVAPLKPNADPVVSATNEGDEAALTRLSDTQRRQADQLVGPQIAQTQATVIRGADLEAHIRQLSLRDKAFQSWIPAQKVAFCALDCRARHVPIPAIINDQVVADIIWQYQHPYGDTDQEREEHQSECIRALGAIGNPKALPTIVQALSQYNGGIAWQAIAQFADPRLLAPIERHLTSAPQRDEYIQRDSRKIFACLARIGTPAIPLLRRFAQRPEALLRQEAVETLIQIGTLDCLPALQEVRDRGADDPQAVDAAIGRIRAQGRENHFTPGLLVAEDAARVWYLAMAAVGLPWPWDDPRQAFDQRNDERRKVLQKQAADLLVEFGPLAVGELHRLLEDSTHYDFFGRPAEYFVAEGAAAMLTRIGAPALLSLIDALSYKYPQTRHLAVEALHQITGQPYGEEPEAWLHWLTRRATDPASVTADARQPAQQAALTRQDMKRIWLHSYLLKMGKRLGCYFTLEREQQKSMRLSPLLGAQVLDDTNITNVASLVLKLRKDLPDVTVIQNTTNPAIVHLIENSLIGKPGYTLDKSLNLTFSGSLHDLVLALAKDLPGSISGRREILYLGGYRIYGDGITKVNFVAHAKTVRQLLTDYIPLASYPHILWDAETVSVNGKRQTWVIHLGPT